MPKESSPFAKPDAKAESHSDRPASFFHYTDAAGLLGIISEAGIWATDARFLSDAQEGVFARELFASAVRGIPNPALQPAHPLHKLRDTFGNTFETYKTLVLEDLTSTEMPLYVTCFCESGDLLSQWRAYGSDHGYAIEFDTGGLELALDQVPGGYRSKAITRVRYGVDAAADVVATVVRNITEDTNLGHVGVHAHYMALQLTAMLAAVKHSGFQEEREWRLVIALEQENAELLRFRPSSMAIVPYIQIPFSREAVISVRVGPGRHTDLRREGVKRVLHALGHNAQVTSSDVPLRG